MKKTIYIVGNPLLPFDNLPIKLKPELEKIFPDINFLEMDPNENIKPIKKGLTIIDTAAGIKDVTLIEDMDMIDQDRIYSCHDCDLGFNLKLLRKIGKLEKIRIYGIPPDIEEKKALEQLKKLIKS